MRNNATYINKVKINIYKNTYITVYYIYYYFITFYNIILKLKFNVINY